MNIITDLQKQMIDAVGHEVSVHMKNGSETLYNPFTGKCVAFTQAIDNIPEVDSICIQMENASCIYELMGPDIMKIEIND